MMNLKSFTLTLIYKTVSRTVERRELEIDR